jgi:ABC-2 type transport system ATP-binding protein
VSDTHRILISVHGVTKFFKHPSLPALDNISAGLETGKILGIAGPDGAGKTTFIRLLAGLLKPSKGAISINGFDTILQAEEIHRLIGYMPQKFGLYEDLTVIQNLNLYADLKGVPKNEKEAVFDKLFSFTSLKPFKDRLAKNLSGGMKQKLGLACSLLKSPRLLLLDEPSVGVDPISRRELWKMVHDLMGEGISVVWSTAYLDEAERCDTVLLLSEGKKIFYGQPGHLTQRAAQRVYRLTGIAGSRRLVLERALKNPEVIDGVIQGRDVRLVLRPNARTSINLNALEGGADVKLIPSLPRFEDAYVDILGGGPGGGSVLADIMPRISPEKDPIIEAQSLTKQFGSFTAAKNITFGVKPGEIFGLLGPNGAGKTTIFKMLCGLLKPTSGKAFVMGLDLQQAPGQARQRIGYMAQKFSLYGDLSVRQNLEFFSGIYNLKGSNRRNTLHKMVEIFNLQTYLEDSANNLPLGIKQRLALSCAVMHEPEVLFLDEPTSGVDPITRREFWNHINGLVEKGVTVMVTTHFMDEAEYCDRIALVYKSRVINLGTPDDLKALAQSEKDPSPTLEDAFIRLIEKYDEGEQNENVIDTL